MNFKEYLIKHGLHDLSKSERRDWHARFRKEYMREYKQNSKAKAHRVELVFGAKDYKALKSEADSHKMRVATYVKKSLEAQRKETYILPDKEAMQKVIFLLSRIGGNVNQIAFQANREKSVRYAEFEKLQSEIRSLKKETIKALAMPQTLRAFLKHQNAQNSAFLPALERVIASLKKEQHADKN